MLESMTGAIVVVNVGPLVEQFACSSSQKELFTRLMSVRHGTARCAVRNVIRCAARANIRAYPAVAVIFPWLLVLLDGIYLISLIYQALHQVGLGGELYEAGF